MQYEPMSALYLTHHSPWPVTSGGRVRDAALIPRLAELADLQVCAISRTAADDRAAVRERAPKFPVHVFADEMPRRAFPTRDSAAARALLRDRLVVRRSVDIVHVEGHYLLHMLPLETTGRIVLVEHNVESHLLMQRAALDREVTGIRRDIQLLKAAEEQAWSRADVVLVLSDEDRQRVLSRVPMARVEVCANGADHVPLRPPPTESGDTRMRLAPRIGFLANYAYPPNQDAVHWLLSTIFPRIQRSMPGAELLLGGFGLREIVGHGELPVGVTALGWLDDMTDFWAKTDIMLCPLRIGGGVKVKLAEAIRAGCFVISTSVGLEGMPEEVRAAVIRAEDADEIADAVVSVCAKSKLRITLRAGLVEAQRALPSWSDVTRSIFRHWANVLEAAESGTSCAQT